MRKIMKPKQKPTKPESPPSLITVYFWLQELHRLYWKFRPQFEEQRKKLVTDIKALQKVLDES